MRQMYLGGSGLVVSEMCLGTMTFGDPCDKDTSRAIVERFREAGGTFFDTADVYVAGQSETILGEIVAGYRDEVVIATKAYAAMGEGPNDRSSSRRHLVAAVDDSLRRLGTDYIDLYQLHRFDPTTPLAETLSTLEDLVRSGKVLYVGISNFNGWQLERAIRMQEAAGYDAFVSLQPQWSLAERTIELETLPAARANNLGILPWSPLAAGFLTGKYSRGEDGQGKGRFARWLDGVSDQKWATLEVVRDIAEAHGAAPASVAIAWLLSKRFTTPIIGATRVEQLDASLAAGDLRLSDGELTRLDEAGAPAPMYPMTHPQASGRPERTLRSP
ncbi:MAG TPA: aldo/keto reductase [Egibacteraceae bacterium]|nr:aldo/keto reductase [Egibacteraceae bacterium]